jgi:hypothetical protein
MQKNPHQSVRNAHAKKVEITYKPLLWRPCRTRGTSRCQAIPGPPKRGDWVKLGFLTATKCNEFSDHSAIKHNKQPCSQDLCEIRSFAAHRVRTVRRLT